MKKTRLWLFLPFLALLSSCALTDQAEIRGRYTHSNLEDNYYTADAFANNKGQEIATYEIDSNHYANGSYSISADATHNPSAALDTTYNGHEFRQGALSKYPLMFHYDFPDGRHVFPLASDAYSEWTINDEGNDADYIGKTFGRSKCLATIDPTFKTGIFSKLYNGQTYCMAISNAALVQADSEGFSTQMPKRLTTGDWFLMSFRGGSTYGEARITTLDLSLRFYKKNGDVFDYYTVKAKNVYQCTDDGGEGVTFFGFQFSDIGFDDRIGLSGWGVSFSNVSDPGYPESYLASEEANAHFGVLIYEVMFPNSSWGSL